MKVNINVSTGELFDKISILQIKSEKIKDPTKLLTVNNELNQLLNVKSELQVEIPEDFFNLLKLVNEKLWLIEDRIRVKESRNEFDQEFISLARDVYYTNDQRCALKRKIDVFFGSEIQEVKDYVDYYSKNIKKEA